MWLRCWRSPRSARQPHQCRYWTESISASGWCGDRRRMLGASSDTIVHPDEPGRVARAARLDRASVSQWRARLRRALFLIPRLATASACGFARYPNGGESARVSRLCSTTRSTSRSLIVVALDHLRAGTDAQAAPTELLAGVAARIRPRRDDSTPRLCANSVLR